MANYEATRYDINGSDLTNIQGISTGLIIPWGSASVPSGFLECNGQSVSTSTYAALFAVIGYTYGGSGASFLLPNLQDRTVVHRSNTKTLGTSGGANTVTQSGNITGSTGSTVLTTAQIPAHAHQTGVAMGGGGGMQCAEGMCMTTYPGRTAATTGATGSDGGHSHNLSATFSGGSNSVLQPYLTLIYIIKT